MSNENLNLDVNGRNIIKKWEGLRLDAYLCPAGVPTIGWGHTGPEVHLGQRITEAEAERLLTEDVQWAERVIEQTVTIQLNQSQFSALTSLIFNIGEGNWRSSTALRRVNASDFAGAAEAMRWWNKARNPATGQLETLPGLVARRDEEVALFLSQPVAIRPADVQRDMSEQMPQQVEARVPATTLATAREALATAGAAGGAATTAGAFFNQLAPIAQAVLIVGVFAVVAVGAWFILRRRSDKGPLKARETVA